MSFLQVTIINVYNDIVPEGSEFIADHGVAFYIETPEKTILFDTGAKGNILLHNMKALDLDPDAIETIVLSHGHWDHSGGIIGLLKERTKDTPITVIAHPTIMELKGIVRKKDNKNILYEFPKIPQSLQKRIIFKYTKEPVSITEKLATLGEMRNRPHKDGTEPRLIHEVNGKIENDSMMDDLSLVLETKNGLVLICGCCHAGLLNTLSRVSALYENKNIHTIIGGTHMLRFNHEEVDFVAENLKKHYGCPKLFLNHCTGINTTDHLLTHFNNEIVNTCLVGKKFTFEC